MTTYIQGIFKPQPQFAGQRTRTTVAKDFRLARKPDGSLCLIAAFEWHGYDDKGYSCGGIDWEELPIVEWHNV